MQSITEQEIELFNNISNKSVDDKILSIRTIYRDGNCYFRSLSYFFNNNQNYYEYYRNYLYNYLKNTEIKYTFEFPYIIINDKNNIFA